ncbi:MAG: hypothetical protein KKG59_02965 [Nanoarchaeota archaeon]|nr:hypothetical protein [Nanoarchaeota archaeon]
MIHEDKKRGFRLQLPDGWAKKRIPREVEGIGLLAGLNRWAARMNANQSSRFDTVYGPDNAEIHYRWAPLDPKESDKSFQFYLVFHGQMCGMDGVPYHNMQFSQFQINGNSHPAVVAEIPFDVGTSDKAFLRKEYYVRFPGGEKPRLIMLNALLSVVERLEYVVSGSNETPGIPNLEKAIESGQQIGTPTFTRPPKVYKEIMGEAQYDAIVRTIEPSY